MLTHTPCMSKVTGSVIQLIILLMTPWPWDIHPNRRPLTLWLATTVSVSLTAIVSAAALISSEWDPPATPMLPHPAASSPSTVSPRRRDRAAPVSPVPHRPMAA